ncbi:M20/M25/M40 family metallo-hydrolase [Conexibacter stalactiti]|uniref:M20/M25/M40 family metallo-hydrolase n=1 Tax=Conexibacter stalactiti TaxID=1940611 RepID=A0ABU4HJB5_9ACTN|nr:M20/M25/M40 family metallo-hydrolase [Conexibacter stalactiti]MDW5593340.1 M20/M25/M40 family metallo-hydrolase [Conexibacter stalactiti]MEC5033981.1 M20/M25/M40 family metallo-hydrolase [Conexibacter stalactiti]
MPADLQQETTELLQRLVQFDTVNPPGNERACQEYLAAHLTAAGFEVELLGAVEERPNLVARLRGEAEGPTLCLLGHVDTVLANPDEWEHDPWSGALADGYLWGRGALDMKSQVAAEVAAAVSLAREGWRPAKGDLLVVSVVDEETGGALGAQWLTQNHPDKVRCDYLLNEGGGEVFEYRGRRRYGVCTAEKGVFRFTLTTDGVAGHASQPKMGDNALLKLAPLLEAFATRQPSYELTEAPAAFLRGLGENPADPQAAVARMAAADPRLIPMFEPMFGVTFTPTKVSASEKINVIPSRARLSVDCRVPPGLGEESVRRALAEVLGPEEGYRLEFDSRISGNGSPVGSRLREAINGWISSQDPAASTVPLILPGFTDSRHFRAAFPDCVAYGFFPQQHQTRFETAPLVHSANERIDVRDLGFAATFYKDVARELLR